MRDELLAVLPLDKYDAGKVERLREIGYPGIEPLLPALLEWLRDGNWPIARNLSPFLAGIGLPLVPHIRTVLSTSDGLWKYWVLATVVAVSTQLRDALRPELERIAHSPTHDEWSEEVDLYAQELLAVGE
ncbi:DUF5071 domain-containing protein [Polaromonas sp. CT11-55]|uniref:DUF5071 domain-containing protein n=1 Tax=Polaromonas sp. CT11-55 TaxID=3243045 RepID=UPI0039A65390